jgi:hypothetical protein
MTKTIINRIMESGKHSLNCKSTTPPRLRSCGKISLHEGQLQEIKHLEAQISSAPATLKFLEDELQHYAARRQKFSHRIALALGSGTSIRLKTDELTAWFLDPNLVAEIRTSVQRHLIDEPQARLREIPDKTWLAHLDLAVNRDNGFAQWARVDLFVSENAYTVSPALPRAALELRGLHRELNEVCATLENKQRPALDDRAFVLDAAFVHFEKLCREHADLRRQKVIKSRWFARVALSSGDHTGNLA